MSIYHRLKANIISGELMSKVAARGVKYFWVGVSLPIALVIIVFHPVLKLRFVPLYSRRLGHFALNTELLQCSFDAGDLKRRGECGKVLYIYYFGGKISNTQLAKMWKRSLPVIQLMPIIGYIDQILSRFSREYRNDPCRERVIDLTYNADYQQYMKRYPTPHISFTADELAAGNRILEQLGIEKGAKYVCFGVRDASYLKSWTPETPGLDHWVRDSDISTYEKAALYLAEQDYYVIRMGKVVEKAFEVHHEKVIDYANSEFRSDFMDIYLSAHCDFFLSTSSGIDAIAQIYRKPILNVNIAFPCELPEWFPHSLFIPKRVQHRETGRWLSLEEMCDIFSKGQTYSSVLHAKGLTLVDNTEDEILNAVKEMLMRRQEKWVESRNDMMLQDLVKKRMYQQEIRRNVVIETSLGKEFLRENIVSR